MAVAVLQKRGSRGEALEKRPEGGEGVSDVAIQGSGSQTLASVTVEQVTFRLWFLFVN